MREVSHIIWGKSNTSMPTTWGADWDSFGAANHTIIALDPSSCCIHEALIITQICSFISNTTIEVYVSSSLEYQILLQTL